MADQILSTVESLNSLFFFFFFFHTVHKDRKVNTPPLQVFFSLTLILRMKIEFTQYSDFWSCSKLYYFLPNSIKLH